MLGESVFHDEEAQWNMAYKQLGWWYYKGVHVVWWVGHPSGRLQLPKAAHVPLTCSS